MTDDRSSPIDEGLEDDQPGFYGPDDTQDLDYVRDLGSPGTFPFTRGIHRDMYRNRLWTMRQYAGFGTAKETNQRFRFLLDQGTSGLSVAFDLPTQIGLDSDHPGAFGEVGRVGVAIDSVADMEELFEDIPLDAVSTSMTINATAAILLAFYLVVARRQGVHWSKLRGTIQNDILKEYVARGTFIYPPEPSIRLVTDTIAFCQANVPRWNPVSISGYHIREAGASALQEAAFTLANAETYLQAALDSGLDIDQFSPRFSFFFSVHNNFFEEIAKFRAVRKVWAQRMKTRGARNPRSLALRFHAQTGGSTLTAQQPENNTVRVTLQALAAILGGAQSLHTNSKDEALALPTEEAVSLALRTQQIIAHESGAAEIADPLGGSWYLERLTGDFASKIDAYLQEIDRLGGVLSALEQGYFHRQIQEAAFRFQKEVESGTRTVVGVNRFNDKGRPAIQTMKIPEGVEARQKERLKGVRMQERPRLAAALEKVRNTASGTGNLLPPIIEAAEAQATVGEIADALRKVFGEHKETVAI
ncbi:MAG: methylmalonyl-CoA mutase [Acidobacteriota bacterium]|nr:MAG: methylmalonyl-CoA mutase [Acidobacteriota bacterium]